MQMAIASVVLALMFPSDPGLGQEQSAIPAFPAQAYASIANAPGYRSTVTVTDYLVGANIARKRVDVEVFYQPIVAWGVQVSAERSVRLSTLIANHT